MNKQIDVLVGLFGQMQTEFEQMQKTLNVQQQRCACKHKEIYKEFHSCLDVAKREIRTDLEKEIEVQLKLRNEQIDFEMKENIKSLSEKIDNMTKRIAKIEQASQTSSCLERHVKVHGRFYTRGS